MKQKYKEELQYSNWDLVKDLLRFIAPYKKKFLLGSFIRVISDTAWLYPAIAVGTLIDYMTEDIASFDPSFVILILGLFVVASFLHYVGRDLAKYFVYQVAERAALDASYNSLHHLISLDIAWQERENSGNKIKRISHGHEGINRLIRLFIDLVIESSINIILITVILGQFDYIIAAGMVLYVLSYYILALVLLRKAKNQSHIVNEKEENVQGKLFEVVNNIATVKWMGLHKSLLKSFRGDSQQFDEEYSIEN